MSETKSLLPKINLPLSEATLPSTGAKIFLRPYTVKEERILLKSVETQDFSQMIFAIKQVVNNCVSGEGFNVDVLPQFDIEHIFLKLYGISKNDTLAVFFKNNNCTHGKDGTACGKSLKVDINVDEIEVEFIDEKTGQYVPYSAKKFGYTNRGKKIMIDKQIGIMIRFPRLADLSITESKGNRSFQEEIIFRCIEGVFDNERYVARGEVSEEELSEFYDGMPLSSKEKISGFIGNLPTIRNKSTVTCETCKYQEQVEFSGLSDFFA